MFTQDKRTGTALKTHDKSQSILDRLLLSSPPLKGEAQGPRIGSSGDNDKSRDGQTDTMTAVVAPLSAASLTLHRDPPRKGSYASTHSDSKVLDLPPIGNGGRVRSRPSSGSNSQKKLSLKENSIGTAVLPKTSQKLSKISVNINPSDNRPRCSPLSPASTGSTASSPMSANNADYVKARLKSWAATEQSTNVSPGQKLETLFERQNTSLSKEMTRIRSDSTTNNQQTRARHESIGNSSSGVYSRMESKVAKRGSLYNSSNSNNAKTTMNASRPGLQRYKSEQNIANQKSRPLRQVKSQGQLSQANIQNSRSIPNLANTENSEQWHIENGDGYESDSDGERDTRIMEWLLGVDGLAEVPPEPPDVIEDGPPQTDTAIHIVYEET